MLRLLTSCLQRMNDTLVSKIMSATYAVDKLLTFGMIKATIVPNSNHGLRFSHEQ